jgi:CubicO group peptidase (beta-lactamase class C family)
MSETVMEKPAAIGGHCDRQFAAVRDAFAANLARLDLGAAVSVWIDGREVVNLWGGWREEARTTPWTEDTLVLAASVSKAFTATCLLQLIEQGRVEVDAPVAAYWPEFRQAGKAGITIRHILSHQGGLAGLTAEHSYDDLCDWGRTIALLERQPPLWEPGTRHGYHPTMFGFLVGEVLRRVSGLSLGQYLRRHVCDPLGVDFWIGLPQSEFERCAEVSFISPELMAPSPEFTTLMQRAAVPGSVTQAAFGGPPPPPGLTSLPSFRAAEMPGSNGHGTGRGVGRFFAALARGGELDGVRVLKPETLERATREEVFGEDATIGINSRFGLGYMLRQEKFPIGPNPRAFGHPGAGGNLGFADPAQKLGFGYVMNRTKPSAFGSPTAYRLVEAVYASL